MIHSDTTPDAPHCDGASESLYNTKQHCITSRELSTCQYLNGRLLIIFANSLNPDQAQQNVGPDLNWKLYNTLMVCMKEIFQKVDIQKNSRQQKLCIELRQVSSANNQADMVREIQSVFIAKHHSLIINNIRKITNLKFVLQCKKSVKVTRSQCLLKE